MRERRDRGRGAATAIAGLVVALVGTLLAPVHAGATDSDLKHAYAFRLEGSNGYSVVAFAANERADGRGEVVLFVSRRDAGAIYVAPAMLTATSVEADLGPLGEVILDVVPTGREKTVKVPCNEEPETISFESQAYRGNFEFHGEEGFTDAVSTAPSEYTAFFPSLLCAGGSSGETSGPMRAGARLRLHSHVGPFRLNLQANKNRPRARTRFEVETKETHRGIWISRTSTLWVGASAFDYDPLLRTARLAPPAPFSGHASFHRGAAVANRWSGNLTVDLPGRSNVPLTGTGIGAHLAPES